MGFESFVVMDRFREFCCHGLGFKLSLDISRILLSWSGFLETRVLSSWGGLLEICSRGVVC